MECTNDIHITGSGYQIGGIVAMNDKGEIKDCDNYGRIQGQERVGGIVGRNTGSVLNCMTAKEANTQGECKVGGIAGNNTVGATISECCNLGTVNSTGKQGDHASTGGIVGYNEGTVQKCINQSEVTAKHRSVGGIVGDNYGEISYCCNRGNISSETIAVGGIAGRNHKTIEYVYNIAEQIKAEYASNEFSDGFSNVGGICGAQPLSEGTEVSIKYAYNTAKIIGKQRVGGIIGSMVVGSIANSYNMGVLDTTETTYVGNIAGNTYSTSAITSSPDTTTQSEMMGWSQATISQNLNKFVKKENRLPILGITVRGITF